MPISVDMTGITTTLTPLPPGYYQAAVAACEQKTSRAGNPYLSWVFNVVSPEEFMGKKAFYNTSLLHNALWNLKRVLLALGVPEENLEGQIELDTSEFLGAECTLVVVEDEYEGETTGDVKQILPAGEVEPVDEEIPF